MWPRHSRPPPSSTTPGPRHPWPRGRYLQARPAKCPPHQGKARQARGMLESRPLPRTRVPASGPWPGTRPSPLRLSCHMTREGRHTKVHCSRHRPPSPGQAHPCFQERSRAMSSGGVDGRLPLQPPLAHARTRAPAPSDVKRRLLTMIVALARPLPTAAGALILAPAVPARQGVGTTRIPRPATPKPSGHQSQMRHLPHFPPPRHKGGKRIPHSPLPQPGAETKGHLSRPVPRNRAMQAGRGGSTSLRHSQRLQPHRGPTRHSART